MRRALAACFLALAAATAMAREIPPTVRAALAQAKVPLSAAAILVEPVEDGAPVLVHQIAVPMNPASVMKLVTTYAALDQLGPAFTFHTDALYTGELADGVLAGDLVLRGGGDPKLTYERLWQLAHQLRSRGLREIRGDVVFDRSYFAATPFDPASFDNEPRRAYNVAPDALLVNFNAVAFHFMPGANGVRVTAEPDLPGVQVVTSVKPNADPCGAWRRDLRYEVQTTGLLATVAFDGSYPVECGERTWPLAILDGPRFAQETWRWVWSEAGGTIRGSVRAGTTPAEAHLLYRNESEPLAALVRDMNKFSNNVMARHIFLALSAEKTAGNGEIRASDRLVRDWLKAKGIAAPELVLENGSGLSRDSRASAATIAAVLRSAWASPVMPELAASFPLLAGGASGRAHLKGGTLSGVQSQAGYVLDTRGRRWIVVVIANHANANAAQPALDALVEWVATRSDKR
jgi:D-alanyl-D-alanine carboxypeptidase/D-alanyl-D-alanine-endopeptidase (penicillin-binding protein 4)